MQNELEIASESFEFNPLCKSNDCKILVKYLGYNHWSLLLFKKVVRTGYLYLEKMEVSCNSIYSPCHRTRINGSKESLNEKWREGLNSGYKSLGWFEQDICGTYRKKI